MKRNENYITWENALFTARRLFCKGSAVDLSALPPIVAGAARYLIATGEADERQVKT